MKLLTAFYDMDYGPVSFDFITWLVRAMFERDERSCDSLHVVIVPNSTTGFAREWGKHDRAATEWRLQHIVVAACPLARATVTVASSREHAISMCEISDDGNGRDDLPDGRKMWWPDGKAHFMGPLVDAARAGKQIPKLRATDAARRAVATWFGDQNLVTLTVRKQETDAERNTDMKSAGQIYDYFFDSKKWVIYDLDDTNRLLTERNGKGELCAFDIDLRLALYERAAMNIIGNNGPQELLKFSDAPYLAFGQGLGGMGADHWRKYFHMELGEQLPWANANQKLCFVSDSFENMRGEFEAWERRGTR